MKIVVTGTLGNISKRLIEKLVGSGHLITAWQFIQYSFFVYLVCRNLESGLAAADKLKSDGFDLAEAIQLDVPIQSRLVPPAVNR